MTKNKNYKKNFYLISDFNKVYLYNINDFY